MLPVAESGGVGPHSMLAWSRDIQGWRFIAVRASRIGIWVSGRFGLRAVVSFILRYRRRGTTWQQSIALMKWDVQATLELSLERSGAHRIQPVFESCLDAAPRTNTRFMERRRQTEKIHKQVVFQCLMR